MRVLAIDPGYERCGVAILERTGGRDTLIFSDCLQTSPRAPFPERLHSIAKRCSELIGSYTPDALALEQLYFNTNQKTAMGVAEVRGSLLFAAVSGGLAIHEYTPGQVKAAITSHGRADKRQVTDMVKRLVKIEKDIRYDDEYDAIAIGIAHLAHMK